MVTQNLLCLKNGITKGQIRWNKDIPGGVFVELDFYDSNDKMQYIQDLLQKKQQDLS